MMKVFKVTFDTFYMDQIIVKLRLNSKIENYKKILFAIGNILIIMFNECPKKSNYTFLVCKTNI